MGRSDEAAGILEKRLRKQAEACRMLGSLLYEHLLLRAAEDVAARGVTFEVMEHLGFAPPGAAVALKLMGAVHRIVLEGDAPELAAFYPSAGGSGPIESSWPAFHRVLQDKKERVRALIDRPVQTNEVGRCAGLLGGFLEVAAATGLPLSLLEVGASGGLNLRWDHYRYEAGGAAWGSPDSPVRLDSYEGALPPFEQTVSVVARAGCDPAPIDPLTDEGRLVLSAYVWPDQEWRREPLAGAFQVAKEVPVNVDRAGAAAWLRKKVAEIEDGVATVLFHSIVMQYLAPEELAEVHSIIDEAGARATDDRPFAWLSMEPPEEDDPDAEEELASIHLTLWPGGERRLIAHCGYHGRPVRWRGRPLYDSPS